MKKKNILLSFITIFTLISLNSCFLDSLQSIIDEKYSEFLNASLSEEVIDRNNDRTVLHTCNMLNLSGDTACDI